MVREEARVREREEVSGRERKYARERERERGMSVKFFGGCVRGSSILPQ